MSWLSPKIQIIPIREADWISFEIENVSRHFVWMIQNVANLRKFSIRNEYPSDLTRFFIPDGLDRNQNRTFMNSLMKAMESYQYLATKFVNAVAVEYDKRFVHRKEQTGRESDINEIANLFASYVLPRATMCDVSFEIGVDDLISLYQMRKSPEFIGEGDGIIEFMAKKVLSTIPDVEIKKWSGLNRADYAQATFDSFLIAGRGFTRLVEHMPSHIGMGFLLPIAIGTEPKHPAFIWKPDLFADPIASKRVESLMRQITYQFATKISFIADDYLLEVPVGIRVFPSLQIQPNQKQNYHIPWVIEKTVVDKFIESVENSISSAMEITRTSSLGFYLLPNAWRIRIIESMNLLELTKRIRRFLCLNVPRETWEVVREAATDVIAVHPDVRGLLIPPCTMRASEDLKPICPFLNDYCGVQAWRFNMCAFDRGNTY